ncbi:MAG: DUF4136 domain-containing protein [Acidiferrobacterales bacterium]|nr:DUF4136 domain-containing protein [Gammaproteobacteria bacterium]
MITIVMRRLAVLCFGLAFASVAFGSVEVDYAKHRDFSRYRSFASVPASPSADSPLRKDVRSVVELELLAKGLTRAKSDPDILVIVRVLGQTERIVGVSPLGYSGYRWQRRQHWGPMAWGVSYIPTVTIRVDLVEGVSKKLIWSGLAVEVLRDKPGKTVKRITRATARIFKKFPPKK